MESAGDAPFRMISWAGASVGGASRKQRVPATAGAAVLTRREHVALHAQTLPVVSVD
jgi:hypothetical protein